MTDKKLIRALRCCADGECKDCAMHEDKQRCQENLLDKAAEAIARVTAENAALREKQRWIQATERLTAKNFGHEIGFCKANRWPEREELIAWMALPEAPKEGEKHE